MWLKRDGSRCEIDFSELQSESGRHAHRARGWLVKVLASEAAVHDHWTSFQWKASCNLLHQQHEMYRRLDLSSTGESSSKLQT